MCVCVYEGGGVGVGGGGEGTSTMLGVSGYPIRIVVGVGPEGCIFYISRNPLKTNLENITRGNGIPQGSSQVLIKWEVESGEE